MSKNWIIEVLGDLRAFAESNNLPSLAEQLEEAVTVASVELAQSGSRREQAGRNGAQIGRFTRQAG